jgi:hypothetical protein
MLLVSSSHFDPIETLAALSGIVFDAGFNSISVPV